MSEVTLSLTLSMADMEPTKYEYKADYKEMGRIGRVSFVPGVNGAEGSGSGSKSSGGSEKGSASSGGSEKGSASSGGLGLPEEHLDFFRDEDGKLIRIRRTGGSGTMTFQLWESLEGFLRTPAGEYPVKTYANGLSESRGEDGLWTVNLSYRLCLGLVDRGVCKMKIEIKA